MATFTNTQKTATGSNAYKLLVGSGFYLTIGSLYELLISPDGASWSNSTKNTSSYLNQVKNSAAFSNLVKS